MIRVAGQGGARRNGPAWQAESLAYFARMTTPPSDAFKTPVNWAIYQWKQAGLWSLIKGLWLHSTDTSQAALLSVIGDTPRDAVVIGSAPTFTALKGFSGLDATHRIKYPITSTILGSDSVFTFLAANAVGQDDGSGGNLTGTIITSDANAASSVGTFNYGFYSGGGWGFYGGSTGIPIVPMAAGIGVGGTLVGGWGLSAGYVSAGGVGGAPNSTSARSSNYITAGGDLAKTFQPLAAYGFLASSATKAQCRRFLAILAELLEELGALS